MYFWSLEFPLNSNFSLPRQINMATYPNYILIKNTEPLVFLEFLKMEFLGSHFFMLNFFTKATVMPNFIDDLNSLTITLINARRNE